MSEKELNDKKIQEDIEFLVRYIREKSALGKFITYTDFFNDPINLNEEEIKVILEKFRTDEELNEIEELRGKETRYFYSKKEMTENYAKLIFRVEEKDLLKMIAQTVRNDSKRFPKTTNIKVFLKEPYHLKQEEITDILKQFESNEEYKDIKQTKASNGVSCLYSEEYLTNDYATALTEWAEVTNVENP